MRRRDAGTSGEPEGNLLPGFHAVFVILSREFGDRQMPVLDKEALGLASWAWREDELEVFVRLLVSHDPLGRLKETTPLEVAELTRIIADFDDRIDRQRRRIARALITRTH